MKKIFTLFISLAALNLFAMSPHKNAQLAMLNQKLTREGVAVCKEHGYRYFIIKSYQESSKNRLSFESDTMELNGDLISGQTTYSTHLGKEHDLSYSFILTNKKPESEHVDARSINILIEGYKESYQKEPLPSFSIEVSSPKELKKKIANIHRPAILLLYKEKCAPCAAFAPLYEKYAHELGEKFAFLKLDAKYTKEVIKKKSKKSGRPTLVFYNKKGKIKTVITDLKEIVGFFEDWKEEFHIK